MGRTETIIKKYGKDYFSKMGKLGGGTPTSRPKGFAARPDIAIEAGKKSKRKKSLQDDNVSVEY